MFWLQVPATFTGVPVLLSDSDNPHAVDIHNVPDVPAASVFSDVNNVPAVL